MVVQLYLKDMQASMIRPVKELAGFARISLLPGETKKIVFSVKPSQLAFLDRNMEWKIEKGRIEVEIGSSSEDIRLKGAFDIGENACVEVRRTRIFCKNTDFDENTI